MPGCRVANIYGPTEATVYATAWYSNGHDQAPPIGRRSRTPAPTCSTRPCARCRSASGGTVPGRSWPGQGLSPRPGLTADRFVADPFGAGRIGMYRTGDVVRWTQAGEIEYSAGPTIR